MQASLPGTVALDAADGTKAQGVYGSKEELCVLTMHLDILTHQFLGFHGLRAYDVNHKARNEHPRGSLSASLEALFIRSKSSIRSEWLCVALSNLDMRKGRKQILPVPKIELFLGLMPTTVSAGLKSETQAQALREAVKSRSLKT